MNPYPNYQVVSVKEADLSFLTIDEVKLYLRIEHDYEDHLLQSFMSAAICAAEKFIGCRLTFDSWRIDFTKAALIKIFLPHGPIAEITSIKCDGEDQEINYSLLHGKYAVQFAKTICGNQIVIDYNTGLNLSKQQLALVKIGLLQHIDQMYHFRSSSHLLPSTAFNSYLPFRQQPLL